MKKVLAIVLSALLLVAALAGCASKSEPASNDNNASADTAASTDGKLETLKVGASSTPHAEILELQRLQRYRSRLRSQDPL